MEPENNKTLDLGERMKVFENEALNTPKILPYKPFIIRLDGRSFSNFTAGLRKPFDCNFTKAMVLTTMDLITEFYAVCGYTHSDEITIIFKESCTKEEFEKGENKTGHIFDGRSVKLLTVMSGYCSVRFNYHLIKIINDLTNVKYYKDNYVELINEMKASFDARLVLFPDDNPGEIVNHMIWRSKFDCERNAVSTYARSHYNQKELNGKSKKEMIEMLKDKNVDWDKNVPDILKNGVYLKKMNYEIEVKGVKAIRTKVTCKTFKINYNEFFVKLINEKLWNATEEEMKLFKINDFDINSEF